MEEKNLKEVLLQVLNNQEDLYKNQLTLFKRTESLKKSAKLLSIGTLCAFYLLWNHEKRITKQEDK